MDIQQANKEHVLAVSRDFISQPRLSKFICLITLGRVCAINSYEINYIFIIY